MNSILLRNSFKPNRYLNILKTKRNFTSSILIHSKNDFNKLDYDWNAYKSENEKNDTLKKISQLSNFFKKFIFLLGVGFIGTIYYKYSDDILSIIQNKNIINNKHNINDYSNKQVKKLIPIPSNDEKTPNEIGLYMFGNGIGKRNFYLPERNSIFDNIKLRYVQLNTGDQNKNLGLIIDENGDLFEWNYKMNTLKLILKDQNLLKIKCSSNNIAYGLNNCGKILVIPFTNLKEVVQNTSTRWSLLWKTKDHYKLELKFPKNVKNKFINDFNIGLNHITVLTDDEKVYTGFSSETPVNKTVLGIPDFVFNRKKSHSNELYEVELLNKEIISNNSRNFQLIKSRKIKMISSGDNHTIALDKNGNIFGFGSNTNGQLSLNPNFVNVPYPVNITDNIMKNITGGGGAKCVDIHCYGNTSIFTIKDQKNSNISYYSIGNGTDGQLGTGVYKSYENEPKQVYIKKDDNTKLQQIDEWATSGDHIMVKLNNGNVMAWGQNNCGQLGTGNKSKITLPTIIPDFVQVHTQSNIDEIFKTHMILNKKQCIATSPNLSCIYWKAYNE